MTQRTSRPTGRHLDDNHVALVKRLADAIREVDAAIRHAIGSSRSMDEAQDVLSACGVWLQMIDGHPVATVGRDGAALTVRLDVGAAAARPAAKGGAA